MLLQGSRHSRGAVRPIHRPPTITLALTSLVGAALHTRDRTESKKCRTGCALWMCYGSHLKRPQSTQVPLAPLTKPFWLYSDTTWEQVRNRILTESRIHKIWERCKYRAPCNKVMKPMSWLFIFFSFLILCVAEQRSKRHRKQTSVGPKISAAQTLPFLLHRHQFMRATAQSARTAGELPDCTSHTGNRG